MKKILLAATFLTALAIPAYAQQPPCTDDKEKFVTRLAEQYGELSLGGGLVNETTFMELYVNLANDKFKIGSFTVLYTVAGGQTCVVAVGHEFNLNG